MSNERVDKINYYLDIAETVSERGTCLRKNYGCIIVKHDEIISTGYSGAPRGRMNCIDLGYCTKKKIYPDVRHGGYDACRSVHAEQNAIIQAGQDRCKDATMYIWGHNFICILCKRFIVQSGIKNVVLRKDENSPVVHVTVDDIRRELEE